MLWLFSSERIAAQPTSQSQQRERRRHHADRGARRPQPVGRPPESLCDNQARHAPRRPTRRCFPPTRSPAIRSPARPGPASARPESSVKAVAGSIAPFVNTTARTASTQAWIDSRRSIDSERRSPSQASSCQLSSWVWRLTIRAVASPATAVASG